MEITVQPPPGTLPPSSCLLFRFVSPLRFSLALFAFLYCTLFSVCLYLHFAITDFCFSVFFTFVSFTLEFLWSSFAFPFSVLLVSWYYTCSFLISLHWWFLFWRRCTGNIFVNGTTFSPSSLLSQTDLTQILVPPLSSSKLSNHSFLQPFVLQGISKKNSSTKKHDCIFINLDFTRLIRWQHCACEYIWLPNSPMLRSISSNASGSLYNPSPRPQRRVTGGFPWMLLFRSMQKSNYQWDHKTVHGNL